MKPGIHLDNPSLSTHYLRMIPYGSEEVISTGTGFIYEHNEEFFIITNGHNVTRTNPEQTTRLTDSAAFPIKIKSKAKLISKDNPNALILSEFFHVDLYKDEDYTIPTWFVHPDKGYIVDVIAIPLEKKITIPAHVQLFPINKFKFDTEFYPIIADDVFILGYPFDLTGNLELPIWKRGTIATEPSLNLNGLPRIYVDTATRSGMSGSPVIMQRKGFHSLEGGVPGSEIIGTISNFVGVYSGRIGATDEFKAQLGIIWKEKVILEILEARKLGTTEFQKI